MMYLGEISKNASMNIYKINKIILRTEKKGWNRDK